MKACEAERPTPRGALYCTKDVGHEGRHAFKPAALWPEPLLRYPFIRRQRVAFAGDYPLVPEWDLHDTQEKEKQVLGCYVSGHPLDRYGEKIRELMVTDAAKVRSLFAWTPVAVAGSVSNYYERNLRKNYGGGNILAFFEISDKTGVVRAKLNARAIEAYSDFTYEGALVLVVGRVTFYPTADGALHGNVSGPSEIPDRSSAELLLPAGVDTDLEPTLSVMNVTWLSEEIAQITKLVTIRPHDYRIEVVESLRKFLATVPGKCPVELVLPSPGGPITAVLPEQISPTPAFFSGVEKLFGGQASLELG